MQLAAPTGANPDDEDAIAATGAINQEEHVKLLMRAEKAERRAAALQQAMEEGTREHAKEVAALRMRLAEAEARSAGGFGAPANLVLGELTPPGTANVADLPGMRAPPAIAPPPPPLGGSRRSTPPNSGGRLAPLAPALAPAVAAPPTSAGAAG